MFRDASLDDSGPAEVLDLITTNLAPAVVGCATAVRIDVSGVTFVP